LVSEQFSHIPPIRWNQLILHIDRIFLFVELVGSVPFHNRTLEYSLGAEQLHYNPPSSKTEHTLTPEEKIITRLFFPDVTDI
jgi:hypothetical protein